MLGDLKSDNRGERETMMRFFKCIRFLLLPCSRLVIRPSSQFSFSSRISTGTTYWRSSKPHAENIKGSSILETHDPQGHWTQKWEWEWELSFLLPHHSLLDDTVVVVSRSIFEQEDSFYLSIRANVSFEPQVIVRYSITIVLPWFHLTTTKALPLILVKLSRNIHRHSKSKTPPRSANGPNTKGQDSIMCHLSSMARG